MALFGSNPQLPSQPPAAGIVEVDLSDQSGSWLQRTGRALRVARLAVLAEPGQLQVIGVKNRVAAAALMLSGAAVFGGNAAVPWDIPTTLYTRDELFAGIEDGFGSTEAAAINAFVRAANAHTGVAYHLAAAQHDFAVHRALGEHLRAGTAAGEGPPVAFLGGSSELRGSEAFKECARAAFEARCQGYRVLSGGATGMMEAALMGGYFAAFGPEQGRERLEQALTAFENLLEHQRRAPLTKTDDRPDNISDEEWQQLIVELTNDWYEPVVQLMQEFPVADLDLGLIAAPTQFYAVAQPTALWAGMYAPFMSTSNAIREEALQAGEQRDRAPRDDVEAIVERHLKQRGAAAEVQPNASGVSPLHSVALHGVGGTFFEIGAHAFLAFYAKHPGLLILVGSHYRDRLPSIGQAVDELHKLGQHAGTLRTHHVNAAADVVATLNQHYPRRVRDSWRRVVAPANRSSRAGEPRLTGRRTRESAVFPATGPSGRVTKRSDDRPNGAARRATQLVDRLRNGKNAR